MIDKSGCKIIVSGIVQGVGFRYFTKMEARVYKLMGHAKNLANGNVEVILYGPREQIEKMLKWLKKGPKTATVSGVLISDIPYQEKSDFLTL